MDYGRLNSNRSLNRLESLSSPVSSDQRGDEWVSANGFDDQADSWPEQGETPDVTPSATARESGGSTAGGVLADLFGDDDGWGAAPASNQSAPALGLADEAQQAFLAGQYGEVLKLLNRLPQEQWSHDLHDLSDRATRYGRAEQLANQARMLLEDGQVSLAIDLLRPVPAEDRDLEFSRLVRQLDELLAAADLVRDARSAFREGDYDASAQALNCIPAGCRSELISTWLKQAQYLADELRTVRQQLGEALRLAATQVSSEQYREAERLTIRWTELQPMSRDAKAQLAEIRDLLLAFADRDRLLELAQQAFAAKDFNGCLEQLQRISAQLLCGDAANLLRAASEAKARLTDLLVDIQQAIRNGKMDRVLADLEQLLELHAQPLNPVLAKLSEETLRRWLGQFAEFSRSSVPAQRWLDQILQELGRARLLSFLAAPESDPLIKHYPLTSLFLPSLLREQVVGLLAAPEEIESQLPLLMRAKRLLGDYQSQVEAWSKLFDALKLWTTARKSIGGVLHMVYHTAAAAKFTELTERLVEAALAVLPENQRDWTLLSRITQKRLEGGWGLVGAARRRIKLSLKQGQWVPGLLAWLDRGRLFRLVATVVAILLIAVLVNVFLSLFIKVPMVTAYLVTVGLLSLWTAFGYAVYRVL